MNNKNARIYVAGHSGLVGSAIWKRLQEDKYTHLISAGSDELNLCDQQKTQLFFAKHKPEIVIMAAAKVGGIHANNTYPAEFIYSNITIATNIIHASYQHQVKKLLNLGSSCIFPRAAQQPMPESALLTGPLEPTNEPYAIAKIAAIHLCHAYYRQYGCDFRSLMPCNLYGDNDNFHLENSHVIPAMIRKVEEATVQNTKSLTLWGSGTVKREFLHAEDLADACLWILKHTKEEYVSLRGKDIHCNIGSGSDISLRELVALIADICQYNGVIKWDKTKPDGTARKLLDVSKLKKFGWQYRIPLREGLERTVHYYRQHHTQLRH